MNFYIDFEATQFSNEIISIGCVADNGNRFSCLVKPHDKKKLTKFIIELTGITQEMLDEDGLSADDAFLAFYEFVKENNDAGAPTYYCYGNNDKDFLKHTVNHMQNLEAIVFAASVQALLVDYSNTVKNYLSTRGLALKKLVALIRHVDEIEQKHDALDDALMLKECYEGLDTLDKGFLAPPPTVKATEVANCKSAFQIAYQQMIDENGLLTPVKMQGVNLTAEDKQYLKTLRCVTWGQMSVDEVPGDATEENYMVKMTHIKKGHVKYFSTPTVAAMFLNGFILKGRSPKETKALNNTMKEMGRNPNNFCGYRCELKFPAEENQEVTE